MSISSCVSALETWASGGTPDAAGVAEAIDRLELAPADRELFQAGLAALWVLGDSITPRVVVEAQLDQSGLLALSLGLLVHTRLLLDSEGPRAVQGLRDAEEVAVWLRMHIDPDGEASTMSVLKRLRLAVEEIQVSDGRAPKRVTKGPGLRERLADSLRSKTPVVTPAPAVRTARRPRPIRGLSGLVVAATIGLLYYLLLPAPSGGLPSPTSYTDVPVVGVLHKSGELAVRVEKAWFGKPVEERTTAALALGKQVASQFDDPGITIELRDPSNHVHGIVVGERIRWFD